MKRTPHMARMYLLLGALLLALPAMGKLYNGVTGKLLVTPSDARGGIFAGSVVYIAHHDFYGAYGVIINKPMYPRDVKEAFPGEDSALPVYTGGPVDDGGTPFILGADRQGNPWYSWREPRFISPATGKKRDPDDISLNPQLVFHGYSGWFMFQLNRELQRKYWDVIDFDPVLVFDTPPEEIWDKAREKVMETKKVKDDKVI